jgi:hypothetical protein
LIEQNDEIKNFNYENICEIDDEISNYVENVKDPDDDCDSLDNKKYIDVLKRYFGYSKFRP